MSSQQSSACQNLTRSSGQYVSQPLYQNTGIFNQAHNFAVTGTFIDGNVTYNSTSNQFMEKLLEKTIPGAEFDSSARDPPPRCHPGTRLAILERCLHFIRTCDGIKKIRWVVGAAGVGKSAIMQNVAESPDLQVSAHATVFFSISGRSDGTKAIMTISYQLAAKSDPYRRVIEQGIMHDPSLLRSSMAKQFNKLIVEPFIHHPQLNSIGRVLIIIDGLDECDNPRTQQEILRLISDLCVTYPSSPLVWVIGSRPETHIASFFSKRNVIPTYEKEEIPVDSDEARADVERFLRDKLTEIKEASDSLDPQWPEERDFWKLANASGGLFAYAHTVVRYIDDLTIGNPVSQLSDVLRVIDNHPMNDLSREEHPMALLDALYDRILSNIPRKIMIYTRKLLLALASQWDLDLKYSGTDGNFVVLCNWLGMTPDEAYAAVNHLQSVLYVPPRDKAHESKLRPFHKSFIDYVSDFTRSKIFPDVESEAQQLMAQCAFRIFKEAPEGVDFGDMNFRCPSGILARGPGTGDTISLTWLVEGEGSLIVAGTRLDLYRLAIGEVLSGMRRGDPIFRSDFCIRLLITRYRHRRASFPYRELRDLVFAESQRSKFAMHGILQRMPLAVVEIPELLNTIREIKLQLRRPATTVTDEFSPWDSSCQHEREGEWEGTKDQNWWTAFQKDGCACFGRLEQHVATWKAQSPDHTVVILLTTTKEHCVEFRFVDSEDGVSEWTYWFWCKIPLVER